ncbi:MAG: STAS domain-containing protein [Melioribacteraceae bacterium]
MNSNTFARKSYLNNTWLTVDSESFLSHRKDKKSIIIDIDLLRATANEADELKEYMESLSSVKNKLIVFNLDKCTFVDSTFLSTIIRFSKKNIKLNTNVRLVISDVRQLSIFKITKIDTIFEIYSTVEQAMA